MIASFRLWLALLICPYLLDELGALRSGNTKLVLENQRLLDLLASGASKADTSTHTTLTDHKWLDPECGLKGCQSLVWKGRYESAVKGRQEFRQAYRDARADNVTPVTQTVRGRQITMRVYFDAAISFIALLGVIFLLAVGFWFYHNWNDIAGIACINGSHEGCREYKPESHTLEGE